MISNYINEPATRALINEYYQHPLIKGGYFKLSSEFQIPSERFRIYRDEFIRYLKFPCLGEHQPVNLSDFDKPRPSPWVTTSLILTKDLDLEIKNFTKLLNEALIPIEVERLIPFYLHAYFDSAIWKNQIISREIFSPVINTFQFSAEFSSQLGKYSLIKKNQLTLIKFSELQDAFFSVLNNFNLEVDPQKLSLWAEF